MIKRYIRKLIRSALLEDFEWIDHQNKHSNFLLAKESQNLLARQDCMFILLEKNNEELKEIITELDRILNLTQKTFKLKEGIRPEDIYKAWKEDGCPK